MAQTISLLWLRRDLRLDDNPALCAAAEAGAVVAIYVLEDGPLAHGGAARWWLGRSLPAFAEALKARGVPLILRHGRGDTIVADVAAKIGAAGVYWNRRYDPDGIAVDARLKETLRTRGVAAESFNGALLREPWELKTGSGGFYRVFTPFWKALQAAEPARAAPLPAPERLTGADIDAPSDRIEDWGLLPSEPDWAAGFEPVWTPGEAGAEAALARFLDGPADAYAEDRNRLDREGTSRLSPHLAHGEISPLRIWRETRAALDAGALPGKPAASFLSEIGWREFSYNLLYHYPDIREAPIREAFAAFPWRDDPQALRRWTRGTTGVPVVDAGMRQLWETGWMHNRARMIVGSFLVKNLLVPWQEGERWFRDTLVDADPASNTASWQWVAGCGADAAPYFRIFNPVTQGERFDPDGAYVRRFVPELARMPARHIHAPAEAPAEVLKEAGVTIGETYPAPIADLKATRQRALDAYEAVKAAA